MIGEVEDSQSQLECGGAVVAADHDRIADRLDDVTVKRSRQRADSLLEGDRELGRTVIAMLDGEAREADQVGEQEGV